MCYGEEDIIVLSIIIYYLFLIVYVAHKSLFESIYK